MKNVLVSIVSKQTAPNVLFIKEKKPIDYYLFLSTPKMAKNRVTQNIINATGIDKNNTETIIVQEDSVEDVINKLKEFYDSQLFGDDIKFFVNITGGTKLMSIGVYKFFQEKGTAEIYYIPSDKNEYRMIFPVVTHKEHKLEYKLNLEEYFVSYGLTFKKGAPLHNYAYAKELFDKVIRGKIDIDRFEVIRKLRNKKSKKKIEVEKLDEEAKILLKEIEYPLKDNVLTKNDIKYLSGGWFEEFIFYLYNSYVKNDKYIGINITIKNENVQNELDISVIHDNIFYNLECKTTLKNDIKGNILSETIYKLTALSRNFGLKTKSFLFTLDDLRDENGEIEEIHSSRSRVFGVRIYDRTGILNLLEGKAEKF